MPTQKLINVHCHLLNFKFIPDAFFKTRAPAREWLFRRRTTGWLARGITFLWPGIKYDKLHEVLAMMKKDINLVAQKLIEEMDESHIVLATPLMMDLDQASFRERPEIPYRYQVQMVSGIAANYPGKLMPFVMFDPRRRSAFELVRTALEKMGFLGVKMYPPLGYHPDPDSFFNAEEVNQELKKLYSYCEKKSIPITTHCSKGGAYSGDLIQCRELVHQFCQPASWEGVLKKYPNLYLNFGHFGGDGELLSKDSPESWSNTILRFMRKYDHVYADLSYHDLAFYKRTSEDYFNVLRELMLRDRIKKRIIFGTDWSMTRHTWKEKTYTEAFRKMPSPLLSQIAFHNPIEFLFPGKKLQPRIKQFFKSKNISLAKLPAWMKSNLKI